MTESNLLVVDWDYFFENKMEAGRTSDPTIWLYDWGHSEARKSDWLWPIRAAGFLQHDLPLPGVAVPQDWWSRFRIKPGSTLFLADSNMYAGIVRPPGGWSFDNVWLFDAHHDCYTVQTPQDLDAWEARGQLTCEDWMFWHYLNDARLHWRYPQWLPTPSNNSYPDWLSLDAAQDDMQPLDVEFDTVFVCQSATWVPPWCDDKFDAFVKSAGLDVEQLDDKELIRDYDPAEAERHLRFQTEALEQFRAGLSS
jgi:hypothetical protein